MKKVIAKKYFFVALLALIVVVEFSPVLLNVYALKRGKLNIPWVLAVQLLQAVLLIFFLYALTVRFGKKVVLVNALAILLIFYSFDFILKKGDPFLKLPFDSWYYRLNYYKYRNILGPPDSQFEYTWGCKVMKNRYGFRERDFVVPKPAGTYRIMVIGDSFTFGTGLTEEQRYSRRLEEMLRERFKRSPIRIEVLNFGSPGLLTTQERDVLIRYKDIVSPDLIIVGFCYNDTGPQDYPRRFRRFKQKFRGYMQISQQKLSFIKLDHIGDLYVKLIDRMAKYLYRVPGVLANLKESYNKDSRKWKEFKGALEDIKKISEAMNLPVPILAILDHFPTIRSLSDLDKPSPQWQSMRDNFEQVRQAALEIGLDVITYEAEVLSMLRNGELNVKDICVCELDAHPSRFLNEVYARKLFERVSTILENSGRF